MKKVKVVISILSLLIVFSVFQSENSRAYSYNCSQYGLFAYSDGLGYCKCMSGYIWDTDIFGYKTCVSCSSKYGYGSTYDYLSNSCKCRSSYVWGTDILGKSKCVLGSHECKDQYGYGSTFDSLSGKCKCSYGYIWGTDILGKDKCVSESQYCHDKYGFSSKFNSLTDKCECISGYELTVKKYGSGLECKSCSSKYGLYSSYDYLSKKCKCDNGYTLNDDNKCVKKQNNVYFILKELDTNEKKAIIKSEYDYQHYLITYGYGCYNFSIKRYLKNKIVVNLGTDFDIDKWDKIVLFNDDEVCDIKSVKKVSSSFSLTPEKDIYIPYVPPVVKGATNIIPEGALIRAINGIDIYIVKYVGSKKFKRLILSPSVFNNYGHLRWEDVMDVDWTTLNSFATSDLVRAVGDDKIYRLYSQGDSGQKRMIKNNSVLTRLGFDLDSIYEINRFDRESYLKGLDLE